MTAATTLSAPARVSPSSRSRWRVPSSGVVAWVWLVALAAIRAGSPEERDPYWEIRAGLENLTGTPLARPDTWSWAPVDGLFYPNSPGWNALLGLSWLGGGYWGLFLITFATVLTFFGLSYKLARRLGAPPLGALAGIMIVFLLAYPMLSARATTAVQVLVLIGLYVPLRWRRQVVRRPAWVSGLVLFGLGFVVSMAGVWTHLSFIAMSAALAVAWAVYWLLSDWPGWRVRLGDGRRWAAAVGGGLGLGLGALTTPYGLGGVLARSAATKAACEHFILEWVSPFFAGAGPQWLTVGIVMVMILVALAVWLVRSVRTGKVDEVFAVAVMVSMVAVPFAIAGMFALRFLGVAAMAFAPVLGLGVTGAVRRAQRWAGSLPDGSFVAGFVGRWTTSRGWGVVLGLALLLLSPLFVVLGPVAHAVPAELRAVESLPSGCRLFATASVADSVILARPDVPVWYDGRADYYGSGRLAAANRFFYGAGTSVVPAGATCVILPSASNEGALPRATARMAADPGWRRAGSYNGFDVWLPVS